VASAVVRSVRFKSLLFKEERTTAEKIHLVLFIAVPFALGVIVRVSVKNFLAADLSFEATILMGVIAGRVAGAVGGVVVGLPALLGGEWLTVPFSVVAGTMAGMLRNFARDREDIWSFTPFIDLSVYRWIRRNLPRPRLDWPIMFFVTIVGLRFARQMLARAFPTTIFSVDSPQWPVELAVYAAAVMSIATALKIWNNTRMEMKLEEQNRLLLQARVEALQSQINPHFLFNTLNSVSSLVRFDPDTARDLIIKLANILRRLLRSSDAFVPFREELEFIDDYLDIEVVRFGHDKLKFIKELDQGSLEVLVPGMLLQPLVENSIKHGLSAKIDGGSIYLRSKISDGLLEIEVEDDGVGMGAASLLERPTGLGGTGIGMANVAERLKVLYGEAARMTIDSREGKGTLVRLKLPLLQSAETSVQALYEARSSTRR
jgi:two-component system LytT family sensor kinase